MLLRYLELNNFLSHQHEEISFPDQGMFLLSGDSGSGKSSFIIDAVAFALYGVKATRARKQADLLNDDNPQQEMHVRAMFDFPEQGMKRIIIERGMDARGQGFTQLYQPDDNNDPVVIAEGAQPVERKLAKLLGGMTWQQFYAAFVARQSEIADLTARNPSDRKKLIHQMLGMRELDKAIEIVAGRLRRHKAEEEQLQRAIGDFDIKKAEKEKQIVSARIEEEKRRLSETDKKRKTLRSEIETTKEKLRPLQEAVESANITSELENKSKSAELELQNKKIKYEKHVTAEKAIKDEESVRRQRDEQNKKREYLRELFARSKESHQTKSEIAQLEEKESKFRLELEQLSVDNASEARTRLEVISTENKHLQEEKKDRREQLAKLKEKGECYVCQRPFSSEHDHQEVIANLEKTLVDLDNKVSSNQQEANKLNQAMSSLENIEKITENKKIAVHKLAELEKTEIRDDLEAVLQEGKNIATDLERIEQNLATIMNSKEDIAPQAEQEYQAAKQQVEKLNNNLQEARNNSADEKSKAKHEQLKKELAEYEEQFVSFNAKYPELEKALASAEREYDAISKELKGRQKEIDELAVIRNKILIAEQVSSYLRSYQRQLASEIRPALEEIGSEMLTRISNGRHQAMHINDDYEITIENENGATLKASMLSGGEEIRANICLRLALTRLVSQRTGVPLGFLIFDEPLPAQDEGHIERILELLDSLRPFYQQQFIISHVGDLRAADEVNYVLQFSEQVNPKIQLINA